MKKKIMGQVNKAVHLITKERWSFELACEATYTPLYREFDYTTFIELVSGELEKKINED